MRFFSALVALSLVVIGVQGHDLPSRYAAQRRGDQLNAGPCTQDSDCQQGCCAFTTGACAGPEIAQADGSGGCGFGNPAPNCNVAASLNLPKCVVGAVNGNLSDPAIKLARQNFLNALEDELRTAIPVVLPISTRDHLARSSQQSKKTVFETCKADSECQQGCCGFSSGKCAGPGIAQTNGSGGCGRGNAHLNCNVAAALRLDACVKGAVNGKLSSASIQAAATFVSKLDNLPFKPT
ncbi:hypothetical protein C8F04DRAFT_1044206 [Mycena alexandri]|uniref:Uncharacterized protein n=1 Tax=Mycena alexandri TaxID=1745969 RepID=A0AAD6X128_9AGAR|nr:hypothetical protein C8F04DRAFT_1044206 [Mycena alexandri]